MDTEYERLCCMWLLDCFGAGSKSSVRLLRTFGSASAVYENPSDELGMEAGVRESLMRVLRTRRDIEKYRGILKTCDDKGMFVVTPYDGIYPTRLLGMIDFPIVLFGKGKLPDFDKTLACAVVGTRKMSQYGQQMAYTIGRGIGESGAILVSGLALGVDGMAMASSQQVGGVTVGVLGCGADVVYPKKHKSLYESTTENGCILSEYFPGTGAMPQNFPKRNRIISGLCLATVVIEAGVTSGSLITARYAKYQGREIFAVPVNVGSTGGEGTNKLIKDGAYLIETAEDLVEKYEYMYPNTLRHIVPKKCSAEESGKIFKSAGVATKILSSEEKKTDKNTDTVAVAVPERTVPETSRVELDMLSPTERSVYERMKPDVPMLPDEIAGGGLTAQDVISSLIMLEIAGAVENENGGYYVRLGCEKKKTPEK